MRGRSREPILEAGAPAQVAESAQVAQGARISAVALTAALLFALVTSCGEGRFPVCKSNADCTERDAGPSSKVCYNLRCVECRYDTDCPVGKFCGSKSECESLGESSAESADAGVSWEPATRDECAKNCGDPECIRRCEQRFRK